MTHIMASSAQYQVSADFELAYVRHGDQSWNVGWFSGDPVAALITWDERWAVIVGEGVLLVSLAALPDLPQDEIRLDTAQSLAGKLATTMSQQTFPCLTRVLTGAPGFIGWEATWFEAVYAVDTHVVRLVADPWSEDGGLYQIDLATFEIVRLISQKPFERDI